MFAVIKISQKEDEEMKRSFTITSRGFSREVKITTLDAFGGAFTVADEIVMGKAVVAGVDSSISLINISNTELYIRDGHKSHFVVYLKNAIGLNGFQFFDTDMSVFVYHGDKELSRMELVKQGCFLHIARRMTQEHGQERRYGDFKFTRTTIAKKRFELSVGVIVRNSQKCL
ncbi:hypothetical protein [uncultured Photobacterium sp.]|uniref:hypothetical protein n=1 Tax=uncultured Photobacterium sp. TaxID=173973 RepID=UPI002615285F|nr:hypothetical protein [uncultured Photobacterium sp.]